MDEIKLQMTSTCELISFDKDGKITEHLKETDDKQVE